MMTVQLKKNKKMKIIDAAMNLFADNGIDNIVVEDILKEAKISRGTFYKNFSSKEAILLEFKKLRDFSRIGVYTTQKIPGFNKLSPQAKIISFLGTMFDWFSGDTSQDAKLQFQLLLSSSKQKVFDIDITEYYSAQMQFLEQLFENLNVPNPKQKAYLLSVLLDGIFFKKYFHEKNNIKGFDFEVFITEVYVELMDIFHGYIFKQSKI